MVKKRQAERPWTVMVYMAAGDSAEMDAFAVNDLREMERGVNEHAHVVVQVNRAWPDAPQRYRVHPVRNARPGRSTLGSSRFVGTDEAGASTGQGNTLSRFIKWAQRRFPAKHYMLVLWGHAYGLGFGRDHEDALTLAELETALEEFKAQRGNTGPGAPLEILGANACAMSYVEAAYELRDVADYMVASQITVPFAGWPYEAVLGAIGKTTEPLDLAVGIVKCYSETLSEPLTGERAQMALLNLASVREEAGREGDIKGAIQHLARRIHDLIRRPDQSRFDAEGRQLIRDIFLTSTTGDIRPLLDCRHLCSVLNELRNVPLFPTIAADLGGRTRNQSVADVLSAVAKQRQAAWLSVANAARAVNDILARLVLFNQRHHALRDLEGIGVFAPFVTDPHTLEQLQLQEGTDIRRGGDEPEGRQAYEKLKLFAGAPDWPRLVYDTLLDPEPSELLDYIGMLGVTASHNQAAVAQIIQSIESSFNLLDMIAGTARQHVRTLLDEHDMSQPVESLPESAFGPPALGLARSIEAFMERDVQRRKLVARLEATPVRSEGLSRDAGRRIVLWFARLELAIHAIEKTVLRGITHDRVGLGDDPIRMARIGRSGTAARGFSHEPPKHGFALEPPKHGFRSEPPKHGFEPPKHGGDGPPTENGGRGLAAPVGLVPEAQIVALFNEIAAVLVRLERAAASAEESACEVTTGQVLLLPGMTAYDEKRLLKEQMDRAFDLVTEASSLARRTIRRVLAHPILGLGPGGPFDQEEREQFANAAGLDSNGLMLLDLQLQETP